jgi:hypothetical protein
MCRSCERGGFGVYVPDAWHWEKPIDGVCYWVKVGLHHAGDGWQLTDEATNTICLEWRSALDATVAALKHGGDVYYHKEIRPYGPGHSQKIFDIEDWRAEHPISKWNPAIVWE